MFTIIIYISIIVNDQVAWSIYNEIDLEKSFFIQGDILGNTFRDEPVIDVKDFFGSDEISIMTNRTLYNIAGSDTINIFESPYDHSDFMNISRTDDLIAFSINNMGIYTLNKVGDTFFENNLYLPETILHNINDPWLGEASLADAIFQGRYNFAGEEITAPNKPLWEPWFP